MLRLKTPIWFILTQRTHPIYPKPRAFDILWVLRSKFKAEEASDASDPRRPLTKVLKLVRPPTPGHPKIENRKF